jgi:hypothetical protein
MGSLWVRFAPVVAVALIVGIGSALRPGLLGLLEVALLSAAVSAVFVVVAERVSRRQRQERRTAIKNLPVSELLRRDRDNYEIPHANIRAVTINEKRRSILVEGGVAGRSIKRPFLLERDQLLKAIEAFKRFVPDKLKTE